MTQPIANLSVLLASLEPVLNDGVYAYICLPLDSDINHFPAIASMREAEGVTLVVEESFAKSIGAPVLYRCAWITLNVHSDLQAVGLTAAFARALGDEGISCNVVAGAYHDHLFVPVERADQAVVALRHLQSSNGI